MTREELKSVIEETLDLLYFEQESLCDVFLQERYNDVIAKLESVIDEI